MESLWKRLQTPRQTLHDDYDEVTTRKDASPEGAQSWAGPETAGLRFESAVRFVIYEVNVRTLRLDYVHALKAYRYVRYSNHCHLYRISPQGDVRARHSGYTLLCSVTMCPTATHRVGLQKCDPHLTMNIDWPGHWPSSSRLLQLSL